MKAKVSKIPGLSALLKKMHSRLSLSNYSEKTLEAYLGIVEALGLHSGQNPAELEPDHVVEYLLHLKEVRKNNWRTIRLKLYGLKYLYREVLDRPEMVEDLPLPRAEYHLPVILSVEEVARFFTVLCLKHRCMFKLYYGSGLRLREVVNLKPEDVDSKRMRVRVHQGKGKKDRYTVLPESLLPELREYWLASRPKEYLFNGRAKGSPMNSNGVGMILRKSLKRAKISKRVTVHSFRHAFACHSIEAGMDLLTLQGLLGHAHLNTTLRYLKVSNPPQRSLFSPLDRIGELAQ